MKSKNYNKMIWGWIKGRCVTCGRWPGRAAPTGSSEHRQRAKQTKPRRPCPRATYPYPACRPASNRQPCWPPSARPWWPRQRWRTRSGWGGRSRSRGTAPWPRAGREAARCRRRRPGPGVPWALWRRTSGGGRWAWRGPVHRMLSCRQAGQSPVVQKGNIKRKA